MNQPDASAYIAQRLGLPAAVVQAVVQVEASSLPWVIDGAPLTRLELHHLWKRWPSTHRRYLDEFFHVAGPQPWQGHRYALRGHEAPDGWETTPHETLDGFVWIDLHPSPWTPDQHAMQLHAQQRAASLAAILDIPDDAVWESASYGGFQIMGFNHRVVDHRTARDMVYAMRTVEGQADAFVAFVQSTPMHRALERNDWMTFARHYNGPGKPEHYAGAMARAYRRLR